jgi:hypothetical protein
MGERDETYHLGVTRVPRYQNSLIMKVKKRPSLNVLTPEIVNSSQKQQEIRQRNSTTKTSIRSFLRERKIMQVAREASRRNFRAKRLNLDPEACPAPDPIWRNYMNLSVDAKDFDIEGCENDLMLYEFAKEAAEQVHTAQIAPHEGFPIISGNDESPHSITLPRSFLLDSIHFAATQHCMNRQFKAGKAMERDLCPAPVERAKLLDGFGERYRSTIKMLMKKTKRTWTEIEENADDSYNGNEDSSSTSETESLDSSFDDSSFGSTETSSMVSEDSTSFDSILACLLDTPESLDPLPDAFDNNPNEFGTDALWSFDASALLAFGILAEEFITRILKCHIDFEPNYSEFTKTDDEDEEETLNV